jgi:hypothetical protein
MFFFIFRFLLSLFFLFTLFLYFVLRFYFISSFFQPFSVYFPSFFRSSQVYVLNSELQKGTKNGTLCQCLPARKEMAFHANKVPVSIT